VVPDFTDLNQPWVVATTGTTANPLQVAGVVDGRHTVLTEQGLDPLTGDQLRFLPDVEQRVVRLGNSLVGAEAETITYRFMVDGNTPVLLLKFAVVFELPAHILENQPRFIMQVLDESGHLLDACTEYDVYSREGIEGFQTYYWAGMPILWRDWTNVGLDLSAYAGQKVQVRIATYDCVQRGHFGYGYFTASCVSRKLTMENCDEEGFTLNAPGGFASYQWNSGHTGSSLDTVAGDKDLSLSCEITSATGCSFTMSAFIAASGRVPAVDTVLWDTICAGEPYVSDYFNLPPRHEVGTIPYEMTFFDPASCSEGVSLTLHLTTHRRYFDREAMICAGEPYKDKDFDLPSPPAGVHVYEQSYPTATGCDSVVRLTLTVSSSFTSVPGITASTSSCAGEHAHFSVPETEEDIRYTWGRGGYPAGGGVTYGELCYNLMDGQGTPHATFQYTDYSGHYYSDFAYIYVIRENGCGSQNLQIKPSPKTSYWSALSAFVCTGEEFHSDEHGFHVPGVDSAGFYSYPHYGKTAAGCDSLVVLHLQVFEAPKASLTASDSILCAAGDPVVLQAHPDNSSTYRYRWNQEPGWSTSARQFFPAGSETYRVTVSQQHFFTYDKIVYNLRCESSAEKQVFVSPDVPEISASICEGESYTANGFDESESGEYQTTVQNSTGACDITLTLNLTVRDTSYTHLTAAITEGEYYTNWYHHDLQKPGEYSQTLTNRAGCDSLVTLSLRVIPRDTVLHDRVCMGDRYTGHGFNTAPVRSDTTCTLDLKNSIGGDSTVTLYLTAVERVVQNHAQTICSGDLPYIWNDTTFDIGTESGVFRFQRPNAVTGCDSIIRLTLTVHKSVVQDTSVTICSAELPFSVCDTVFGVGAGSGVYPLLRHRTATGCDSLIRLHLTVNDSIVQYKEKALCESGLPYTWNDTTFGMGTESGVFRFQYTSALTGCDSIVYLDLTVNDSIIRNESLTICRNELPYTWGDTIFEVGTVTGTFCFRGISQAMNCDSIVWLSLVVNEPVIQDTAVTICEEELPFVWRDTIFQAGTTTQVFRFQRTRARTGCDSIVNLTLTVHDSIVRDTFVTICSAELPFTVCDTVFGVGAGSDVYHLWRHRATTGCDSLIRLHLTVHDSIVEHDTLVICRFDLPVDFRGNTLPAGTESGTVRFQQPGVRTGCDSIVYLNLTVHDTVLRYVSDTICTNDLPYRWRDTTFDIGTTTGEFYFLRPHAVTGCDSTVRLHLTVLPVHHTVITDTVCSGSPYRNGMFFWAAVTEDKREVRVPAGVNGCDSVVELFLHAAPVYLFPEQRVICEGSSYNFRGNLLTAGGVYADTLHTVAHGCDSIYRLELTVHPLFDTVLNGEVCEGDRYTAYGFDETATGTYYQYLTSAAHCDSTVRLELVQKPNFNGDIRSAVEACEDRSYLFSIENRDSSVILPIQAYRWDFGDGDGSDLPNPRHRYYSSGTYRVEAEVTVANGCKKILFYDHEAASLVESLRIWPDKTEITDADPEVHFRTDPADGVRFIWDFGDGTTAEGAEVTHVYNVVGDQEFLVQLRAVDADSCVTEERFVLPAFLHIAPPNIFSPNDDGFNDRFMPGMRVRIVNRNGVILYEGENGWDGTYRGKKVSKDTYFYEIWYWQKGKEKTKKGYITVVL
jgi:gliding motility-associated-like protein